MKFLYINNVLTDDGDNLRQVLEDFGKMNYNYSSSYNLLRNSAWHDVQITNTTLTRAVTYSSVIQSTGYGYYELSSSPDTVTITLQLAGNAPTAVTCWIIEGFGTNNVAKSTKIRLTSRQLTLSYTLTNALAEDLCLIIENTSTSNNATVSITVN